MSKGNVKEEWRYVEGWNGYYMVSNVGEVKSIDRIVKYSNGGSRRYKGRVLKFMPDKDGYCKVKLSWGKKRFNPLVHRLVATAFLNNDENFPVVNHMDGVKTNNCVDNLEWCTFSHNTKHACSLGLIVPPNPNGGMTGDRATYYYKFNMLSLDGKFIRTFNGTGDASKFMKRESSPHIINCAKGRLKSAYGYIWEYTDGVKYKGNINRHENFI